MVALMETETPPGALGQIFCFRDESVGRLPSSCSDCGPGAGLEQYKMGPAKHSLIHSPLLHLTGNKVSLEPFLVLLLILLGLLLFPHNPLLGLLLTFPKPSTAHRGRGKLFHGK